MLKVCSIWLIDTADVALPIVLSTDIVTVICTFTDVASVVSWMAPALTIPPVNFA